MLSRLAVAAGHVARSAPALQCAATRPAVCSVHAAHGSSACGCCGRRHFSKKAVAGAPRSIPVNTLTDGSDPVERPDAEYPEWLWQLTADKPSESEFLDRGLDNLTNDELEQ